MINRQVFSEGQMVWVRSYESIVETLDDNAKLGGLLFAPEMTNYCDRPSRITGLPTHTCVEGLGMRGLQDIVFLDDLHCDGEFHDGCRRECRLFWHVDWLTDQKPEFPVEKIRATTDIINKLGPVKYGDTYRCQSTELAGATRDYNPTRHSIVRKAVKYLHRVWQGKLTAGAFARRVANAIVNRVALLFGIDRYDKVRGKKLKTEVEQLNLQPGEWVQVKTREQIEETLDVNGKNKGLSFETRMLVHCGGRYKVAFRPNRMIREATAQMIPLQNTVILEGVQCNPAFCPRADYYFWREAWLERIDPLTGQSN